MFRFLFAPVLILAGLLLAGCTSSEDDSGDAPKKAAAPLAPEMERQLAWDKVKELIERRAEPAAIASAIRDAVVAGTIAGPKVVAAGQMISGSGGIGDHTAAERFDHKLCGRSAC